MITGELNFINETIKTLTELGYLVVGHTREELEEMMKREGYKKGYNTWIKPGDFVPDED